MRRGLAVGVEEQRAVLGEAQRHELRRQVDARPADGLGQRVVRREARHQRDVDAEPGEIGELEVEERQVASVQDGREGLDLRAEARGHAAREHDGGDLAALDGGAPERGDALALLRPGGRQLLRDVLGRHLDGLGDAVQRLRVGECRDEARPQLLERDALEVEALEQRGDRGRERRSGDVHQGAP